MVKVLNADQMRSLEGDAIARGAVSGLELMERAGKGVIEAIFEEWPEWAAGGAAPRIPPGYCESKERAAIVLCGPGNNGGDGFVVARLLREAGWKVRVFLFGAAEKLPPDARANYERWLELGAVVPLAEAAALGFERVDLVVDAVFGTGLKRGLPECVAEVLRRACGAKGQRDRRIVAIDIASGFDADSGRLLRGGVEAYRPDLTVSFSFAKLGHYLAPLAAGAGGDVGRLVVKPIGVEALAHPVLRDAVDVLQDSRDLPLDRLSKTERGHKYQHGAALVLSGPPGRGGAARLAARGALRIGAGLVTIGCCSPALTEHAAQLNAIMLKEVDGPDDLAALLADRRITALCLGPGFGLEAGQRLMIEVALRAGPAVVLDADALSIFRNKEAELFALCHDRVVLTPHGGEFRALFPDLAERLEGPAEAGPAFSKVEAARAAAKRAGAVVLLKGADSVIAAPDGRCAIHAAFYERRAPWLATAGSGDVLAGLVTGLLARGVGAYEAAGLACWLHVEAARAFGPGLIAEDLPEVLPQVLRRVMA